MASKGVYMNLSDSQMIAKTFSVWYYKWIKDPSFNPEDPTSEQEDDYDLILKQIREGTFTEEKSPSIDTKFHMKENDSNGRNRDNAI